VKLNPRQKQYSKKGRIFFYQQIGLTFKEGTTTVIHLENSFEWCSNLGTSESRSEILGKF
jgi:hypothetical protein